MKELFQRKLCQKENKEQVQEKTQIMSKENNLTHFNDIYFWEIDNTSQEELNLVLSDLELEN